MLTMMEALGTLQVLRQQRGGWVGSENGNLNGPKQYSLFEKLMKSLNSFFSGKNVVSSSYDTKNYLFNEVL